MTSPDESDFIGCNQEQADELKVLRMIFGGGEISFEQNSDGLPKIQFFVSVQREESKVIIKSPSSCFEVSNLPPILVSCTLPPGYPLEAAPLVDVESPWISHASRDIIIESLLQIHEAQKGMPIIFSWHQWLQDESWRAMECAQEMLTSNEEAQKLRCYDARLEFERFQSCLQTCTICFDERMGDQFIMLEPCGHRYCLDCIHHHCESGINSGMVMRMSCPEFKCNTSLTPTTMKEYLPLPLLERWEMLLLNRAIDSMGVLAPCPSCKEVNIREDDPLVVCVRCRYPFCAECNRSWHGGSGCMFSETDPGESLLNRSEKKRLLKLQEEANRKALEARAQQQREAEMRRAQKEEIREFKANEAKYASMIKKGTAQCPSCRMRVLKMGGCNKIMCFCGVIFCYICCAQITSYHHFQSSVKCSLYDTRPFDMNEPEPAPTVVAIQPKAQRETGVFTRHPTQHCPKCRDRIPKTCRNNHLLCTRCNLRLCFLCGSHAPSTTHFRPWGCRQHT